MPKPLTQFDPASDRLVVIQECMANYDVGSADDEWPNNIISRKTVIYGSGVITRQGDAIQHRVNPDELALCKRLSAEICRIMEGTDVGMGSESSDPFRTFFIAANIDDPPPDTITDYLIRSKFGGTLFPPVTITVEPLQESGTWWSEVLDDARDYEGENLERYLQSWRSMIQWLQNSNELSYPVFVRICDSCELWDVPKEQYPDGTEITGSVLPRLALGLSPNGSLIGICGYTVQT